MYYLDFPIANFTISEGAKRGIDDLRRTFDAQSADPAAVLCIGWGRFMPNAGPPFENVVVTFYGRSYVAEVAKAIQNVSGVDVVFYANSRDYPKFEGKILEFSPEHGFFLGPRSG